MQFIILTNNPLVTATYPGYPTQFVDGSYMDVLVAARNNVHNGFKLLSHPLSGSVKPNENPFKTVLMSLTADSLDLDSLGIIENCIITAKKFPVKYKSMSDDIKNDFAKIDCSLISCAFVNNI